MYISSKNGNFLNSYEYICRIWGFTIYNEQITFALPSSHRDFLKVGAADFDRGTNTRSHLNLNLLFPDVDSKSFSLCIRILARSLIHKGN